MAMNAYYIFPLPGFKSHQRYHQHNHLLSPITTNNITSSTLPSYTSHYPPVKKEMWSDVRICPFLLLLLLGTVAETKKKNLVTEFVKESGSSIFDGIENTEFAILIESKQSEDYDDYLDEFKKAAEEFRNKVRFVYINSDTEENWQLIEFLGLIAEDVPGVLFIDLKKHLKKYKAEMKEITKTEIISFIQSCLDGKAIPFLKSDEIPDDWNKKPVIELVGKNFEKQVFDPEKTTFVFFYAPWCEACQKTMPEIEKLGELYKNKKNLVIAKMNSMNNEIFGLPILDVPTIALFIKGSKKPVYHTKNERTANNFSEFIAMNLEKDIENSAEKRKEGSKKEGISESKNKDKEQLNSRDEL